MIYLHCLWTIHQKQRKNEKNFKETGNSRYIYQKELNKSCFQQYLSYGDFKDLPRKTAADKVLRGRAFNIFRNLKYDGYQRSLASMV